MLVILLFASVLTSAQTARILAVFPFPSISHQVVFRKLTLELAKRGHNLTVITPDPAFSKDSAPHNYNEIDVHDISYKMWQTQFQKRYKVNKNFITFTEVRRSPQILGALFKKQMEVPQIQEIISSRTQKFDLIIIEAIIRPALALSHIFKAPVILVSSMGAVFNNHNIMGSPTHPLLYPTPIHQRIYNLTLLEKLNELYTHFTIDYALFLNEADEDEIIRENFGSHIPPLNELYNNVDMLFINIHSLWADNQPVPPNIIYMGGIHQLPEKELPNDLKSYLESSKNGVIYLSFGTNVLAGMMPPDKIQIIIDILSKLPYDVLWKWDKDELPGKSSNIKISKWFPQSDLLRHPKIKLFITQAGLQSTDEAITAGVPLVALPMLGDQWYNAEKYVKYGIGEYLHIKTITADVFKDTVETVINDESYRNNVVRLRELMQDQPQTPLDRAVWWTEYVIRHGGAKELRAASANLSYAEYYEFELILLALSGITIFLIICISFILLLIRLIDNSRMKKIKKN